MLSVKQGGIKYHFLVFGMAQNPVSRAIGEYSNR